MKTNEFSYENMKVFESPVTLRMRTFNKIIERIVVPNDLNFESLKHHQLLTPQ